MNGAIEPQPGPDSIQVGDVVDDAESQSPRAEQIATDNPMERRDEPENRSSSTEISVDGQQVLGQQVFGPPSPEPPKSAPVLAEKHLLPSDSRIGERHGECSRANHLGTKEPSQVETQAPASRPLSTSTAFRTSTKANGISSDKTTIKAPQMRREHSEAWDDEMFAQFRPDTYHAPHPRRRPSALDYLVSVSPTATPITALGMSYTRSNIGANHPAGFSELTTASALNGSHGGDAGRERPVDSRYWSSHFPGSGQPSFMPAYPPRPAFPSVLTSSSMAPRQATTADVPHSPTSSGIFLPYYRIEKPPLMSGYQLLATQLAGGLGTAPVTPIYRRFEALNHRLLLYMQADIVDLKNELSSLDLKDNAERGYGIVPASRRHERWANSALGQQRTEILGQIGYKLSQYNMVMASLRKTQDMPAPLPREVHEYRLYLADNRMLAEEESRFLDITQDLISLARGEPSGEAESSEADDDVATLSRAADEMTMPARSRKESESDAGFCAPRKRQAPGHSAQSDGGHDALGSSLSQLALAMFLAVFVPVFTFVILPGFAGRITVVALVGSSVATVLVQSGVTRMLDRRPLDWFFYEVAYGATMTAVAGILS